MPDPPGPPGLNTSEPMRRSSSAVAARATATSIVSPSGAAWSSGTTSVAHSSPAISAATPAHDDQVRLPVSGFGVTGVVVGAVAVGAVAGSSTSSVVGALDCDPEPSGSAPTVTTSGDVEHAETASSAIRARTRRTRRRYRSPAARLGHDTHTAPGVTHRSPASCEQRSPPPTLLLTQTANDADARSSCERTSPPDAFWLT